MNKMPKRSVGRLGALVLAAALGLSGCDVTNPGQVLDEDLNNEQALRIVVNGLAGDISLGHTDMGWNMNVMTGDMSGTSAYKSRVQHWQGKPDFEDAEDYNSVYKAVNVADRAIERINAVLEGSASSSALAAEAYMYAGFANRIAGDGFCQAVIDGGAPQPRTVYWERAEDYFTQAIQIAGAAGAEAVGFAAYGGRASVRAQLGDWQGALSDAAQVPDNFQFDAKKHGGDSREWNRIYEENARRTNLNNRWTWFDSYAAETGDPRVELFTRDGVTAADGSGLQLIQGKFPNHSADIALTKGQEMRLLEAEYYITQDGDWQRGLDIVNAIRTGAGMDPWTATNADEAFTALKLERGIVLWLESRRGGDLYRWGNTAAGDPIIAKMYENTPSPSEFPGGAGGLLLPQDQRAICFPFSLTLQATNSNIS